MKRPSAVIGFVYLAASAVAVFLGKEYSLVLAGIFLLGFAVTMKSRRLRSQKAFPAAMLTALAAMLAFSCYTALFVTPTESFLDKSAMVKAELCELPYTQYDRYYYELRVKELEMNHKVLSIDTKILVYSQKPLEIEPFDTIEAVVSFDRTVNSYRLGKGITLTGHLPQPEKAVITSGEGHRPLFYYALQIRKGLSDTIHGLLPEKQAAFVSGFLLGEKNGISEEVRNDLQAAGLSHIIVVSGLHLSILTGIFYSVVLRLLRHRTTALLLTMLLVLSYMTVTGFSPSVIRAGIMQLIYLAAVLMTESSDSLNSLGFSVWVIIVLNPYAAADISLLLSFSATLGIIFGAQKIAKYSQEHTTPLAFSGYPLKEKISHSVRKNFFGLLGVSLSAYVFTIPVTVLYFHRLSVYSVLSNMASAPVIMPLMTAVVLMLLFHFSVILSFLAVPCCAVVSFLSDYITGAAAQTAHFPFAVLSLSYRFVPWWAVGMIILSAVLFLCRGKKYRVRILVFTGIFSLTAGVILTEIHNYNSIRIAVLDTGSGASIFVLENNKAAVLSCGGDYSAYYSVKKYLSDTQIQSLSLMLLTSRKGESSAYAERLLQDFETETVLACGKTRWEKMLQPLQERIEICMYADTRKNPMQRLQYDDKTITVYETSKCHAFLTELHGYRILFCQSETDAALLPDDWKNGDLLILNGFIDNKQELNYSAVIIADIPMNRVRYLSLSDHENIYRTYEGQHIVVRLYPDNQTQIRRESLWVS